MNYQICYGYVAPKNNFYVTDLFYKQIYDYVENQKDFVFHRRWGDRHNCQTSVSFKNVRIFGTHYRKTFWELYVYSTNISYFIKRKGDVFTYGTYDCKTEICDEKNIDLNNTSLLFMQDSKEHKEFECKSKIFLEDFVDKMIITYSDLFSKIHDKEDFIDFLTDSCNDIVGEIEMEEELQRCVAEGRHIFEFYLDSENFYEYLKQEVNLNYVLNEFPYLSEYVDKIDICSILNEEKTFLEECTMDDWIHRFKTRVDEEISKYLFATNIGKYTVDFFLDKYSNLINNIKTSKIQQEFLETFEKELELMKNSSFSETNLFYKVERYIRDYVVYDSYTAFVTEYGQDTYIIELTEEKEMLFNSNFNLNILSDDDRKQFTLYRKLKQIQSNEMYNKNGKTIKASFSSIPKLISKTENLITILEKLNMISLEGETYDFVSFEHIHEFINLVKDC